MIRHLIAQGIKDIYIGVGGTASNDGGIGIAAGLGYRFYNRDGNVLPACGQSLSNLASVSIENRYEIPEDVQIRILADVVESTMWSSRRNLYVWQTKRARSYYVRSRRSGNTRFL